MEGVEDAIAVWPSGRRGPECAVFALTRLRVFDPAQAAILLFHPGRGRLADTGVTMRVDAYAVRNEKVRCVRLHNGRDPADCARDGDLENSRG